MRVLVTGGTGQLGHDVSELLDQKGFTVAAPTHEEMDITDPKSVSSFFSSFIPNVVIHCAAWTNVDLAESNEESCMLVNHIGTRNMVDYCRKYTVPIVYISTDYVFNGNKNTPWDINDEADPQNVYGLSKYRGEIEVRRYEKHFILRISWVFGSNGNNFVKTMIRLSKTMDTINVVCDQFGSPTYTRDVARLIVDMITSGKYGTYHACNSGSCSWAQFAEKIFILLSTGTRVNPISSDEWRSAVKRPKNSILDTSSLEKNGFSRLPTWEDALNRFIIELKERKML